MPSSECLPEERIAELVEGRLTGDALGAAEQHLVGCSECRSLVTSMANAVGGAAPAPGERPETEGAAGGETSPILQKNDRVGRYVIQRLVGAGGMGRVYAAHDPSLDRRVALKLLRPDVAAPDLEPRLLREAKAMARITHPHVIAVHDTGRHGDQVYIAMEFVEGGTLREWVHRAPRTWREIVEVYARAGEGLAEAHAAGIVHRDFKPDNVLVGDDGKAVRVTDFGLARAAVSDEPVSLGEADTRLAGESSSSLDSALTRTGTLVGTPVYMAPEQHSAEGTDARSDVYAFCVALYEALYGERPFSGTSLAALHAAKLAEKVRPPPKGTRVPQRVRRVVLTGLAADPARRPQTMASLLAALRRGARRPRLPWVAAGGIAVGLAAATVYGAGARQRWSSGAAVAGAAGGGAGATGTSAGAAACSNARCAKEHGGQPWVCRKRDNQCVAIDDERCKAHYEPGDLEAEDTVWLGAMFPMTGPLANVGKTHVAAVELGRRELAQATRALTGPNASLRVKRVAVVACDDAPSDGAMGTAEHLVDDVGVPAILGFRSGQEVVDLAGGLLIQRRVVAIATLSPNALVTQVPQPADLPRMVWRTTFGLGGIATATAAFIHDYFEPRRAPSDGPTRVALLRSTLPGEVAFGQALLKSLTFNGKSAVENGDRYQEITLPQVDAARVSAEAAIAGRRILEQTPSYIVVSTGWRLAVPVLRAVEAGWPRAIPRPTYFLASGLEGLSDFVGRSADLRRRVLGVLSSSDSAANAHFVIRFNDANADHVSRTENPGSSYDAFYLLALGTNASGAAAPDGVALARTFQRLNPPGRPFEVGPTDALEALSELSRGRSIDLEGATSSLNFDTSTGEVAFDTVLVCNAADASGESVESGVAYRASRRRVSGTLACP